MNSPLNWLPYVISQGETPRIKDEPTDSTNILPSPSLTSSTSSVTSSSSSSRRGSTSSSTGPKRQRPYPSLTPDLPNRRARSDIMSSSHSYGTWSGIRSGSGRPHPPVERRSSDEEQSAYGTMNSYMSEPYMVNMADTADLRPPSSNSSLTTSSLVGAMGETSLSSQSRSSRSPPSNAAIYSGALPSQDLSWTNNPMTLTMNNSTTTYSGHPNHLGYHASMGSSSVNTMQPFNDYAPESRNGSPPATIAPPSPSFPQSFSTDRYSGNQMVASRSTLGYGGHGGSSTSSPYNPSSSSSDVPMSGVDPIPHANQEMRHLRRRVRELEMELNRSRTALDTLRSSIPSVSSGALPTPPHSSSFQAGWKARTEARRKLFCSLNRAGNALCAWHDSRRERRAFPPRNAPPGYLNCGCTYNEALFEESLARHGVGSYHPGETVRMDPALRNPLLKLLEQRYGYKDGDFEHDPMTEEWADGESPALWEQKAHSGQTSRRRPDGNDNRG